MTKIDETTKDSNSCHIPAGVYYNVEHDNFYCLLTNKGMGNDFYSQWKIRNMDFPTTPVILEALGWAGSFSVLDPEPDNDHSAIYLVCPNGLMVNTSCDPTPGLDARRTQWMADTLNAALESATNERAVRISFADARSLLDGAPYGSHHNYNELMAKWTAAVGRLSSAMEGE
jgi:hypothetical protein